MASERTFVTEVATGLGMFGDDDLETVISRRPADFVTLCPQDWDHLAELWGGHRYGAEFVAGFINGREFLAAPDALNGRRPRIVEWTGGRRPRGDEVVPSDLRVDHVYLVSCKYLSGILHNPSPARLVDGLLSQVPVDDTRDWYERVAPDEYQELYEACAVTAGLPRLAAEMTAPQRRQLAGSLAEGWPAGGAAAYERLCAAVASRTAEAWASSIARARAEALVTWRLLRIGSAPYFVLGSSPRGAMRLRIDTPWDWRQRYRLRRLDVEAQRGGQPRVGWSVAYEVRGTDEERFVRGHVEIRWSHGRFAQPPEAKVYLDSRHEDVPGYHPL